VSPSDISEVRTEDTFDLLALSKWLSSELNGIEGIPEVMQYRSGASNLTYLLKYPHRELVLRRPPPGNKATSAHDMKREFLIQQKLKPVFPYVPEVFALCDDPAILGSDFYVMEKITGYILRRDLPNELKLKVEDVALVGTAVIEGLVQLHKVDSGILSELNKGPGYVARQVHGWSNRYRAALTDDVPGAEELMIWLQENQPGDIASCIIHGDWRLDNMVFNFQDSPTLVGVLDWELATVGDPLMDLGSAMAYWIDETDEPNYASLRRQPSNLLGMPTRAEFISGYLDRAGWAVEDFTFYEIFGLFRLTVILQQIWARYVAGQTSNPAFTGFGWAVNVMIERAMGLI
jgi:aminoglycoside phosphotransferase (APT) family kinase protein